MGRSLRGARDAKVVEARVLADDWGALKEMLSRCCVETGRKRREEGGTDYHPPVRATERG